MSKLFLVRHGQTAWHAEGRYAGTADVPLDDVGKRQVERVVERLKDAEIHHVYSSPLSRCLELAQRVADSHGHPVTVDERVKEIDLGRWDGETYKEIFERDGEILSKWLRDPGSVAIPGGEKLADVQRRSMDWFSEAMEKHPDQVIIVSSHGGPIRAILAGLLEIPLSNIFKLTVDLASISIVNYKQKFTNLEVMNDTVHLEGLVRHY